MAWRRDSARLKSSAEALKIPTFLNIRKTEDDMTELKRAGIYARVSTLNAGQDPGMQVAELTEYCKRRGWKVAGEYIDKGISGATDSRPELNRLMADAHRRAVDCVVCWKFDRFARSTSHLLRALETFRSLGIDFVSVTEQIDTSTPTGKMVFTILGSVSEIERSLCVERVKCGMKNARAKGKIIGRPPLRRFSRMEMEQIRASRKKRRSIRQLAIHHQTTQYTINRIVAGQYSGS
jgi:DNA invertase Pin-like site-specific DNA recombinase